MTRCVPFADMETFQRFRGKRAASELFPRVSFTTSIFAPMVRAKVDYRMVDAAAVCTRMATPHSTVTLLARLRGWSTSVPLCTATW